ncbi:hypothetical protein ACFL5J_00795 [Thermodesulfobacteriota bacterium]
MKLAYQACQRGGTQAAVLNAANEIAVAAFLEERIRFPEIALVVAETISRQPVQPVLNVTTVLDADLAARMQAESVVDALMLKARQRRGEEAPCPSLPPQCDSFSDINR